MSDDLGLLGGHPDDDGLGPRRDRPDAWGGTRATPRQVGDGWDETPGGGPGGGPGDEVPPGRRRSEARRARERRSALRRRRRVGTALALVVLLALAGGVYLGGRALLGSFGSDDTDFAGPAGPQVVVRVASGDTTAAIGATLVAEGVVGSTGAFATAAAGSTGLTSVQPGYYVLPTAIPSAQAVSTLLDPAARVGQLVVPEGRGLDDITGSTGIVTPGILSLLSQASCVTLDGQQRCVPVEELRTAAATADPTALGVPEFAVAGVTAASDTSKRLEGLIRPGAYDLEPGTAAEPLLRAVLTSSATTFQALNLTAATSVAGLDAYQVLAVASLVEREALPDDFTKVSRVIYNRLAVGQKLEFDSTVNYPLDVQAVATTPEARAEVTPWNTYASPGLPQTPISSPSDAALRAAEEPAEGAWLYFVTIDTDGTTVFSNTFEEHEAAILVAQANGVFG